MHHSFPCVCSAWVHLSVLCLALQRDHPPYHQGHLFRGFPESQLVATHGPGRPSSPKLLFGPLFILLIPPQCDPFSPLVRHLPLPCENSEDIKKFLFFFSNTHDPILALGLVPGNIIQSHTENSGLFSSSGAAVWADDSQPDRLLLYLT